MLQPNVRMYIAFLLIALSALPAWGQESNGCKVVTRDAPTPYSISPGTYDPALLNTTYCVRLCGGANLGFSGLELGNICLCAQGPTETSATTTGCTTPCVGVNTEMCGGQAQASTYKSAIPIEGLTVTVPQGVFNPDQDVRIESAYTKGADLTFTYRLFEMVQDAQVFEKKFRIPGIYDVQLTASNPLVASVTTATGAVIDQPVEIADLTCPVVVPKGVTGERSEEFHCWSRVVKGSWLTATMNFVDRVHSFDVADPIASSLGAEIPVSEPPSPGTVGTLYLANKDPQRDAGDVAENGSVVIGFEYYATQAGDVKLLVLEPVCSGGQSFCLDTNDCSNDCHVACTSAQEYCPLAGKCVTSGSGCTESNPLPDFNSYKVKKSVPHTAVVGYNWVPQTIESSSDNITLSDGDIIGVHTTTGVVGIRDVIGGEAPYSYKTVGAPAEGAIIDVATYTKDKVALVRAVTNKPSDILLPYLYMNVGDYATSLVIKNRKRPSEAGVTLRADIAVQLGVDYCIPTVNGLEEKYFRAKTNFDIEVAIIEPSGNGVNYEFTFGTDPMVTGTALKRSHKFTSRGVYNITVRCYNRISSKDNQTQVLVEDQIVIDSLTCTTPKEVDVAVDCTLTMSSGSNYHCNWTWDDGQAYITEKFESLQTIQNLQHIFVGPPRDGVYDVTVGCSNLVHKSQKSTQVFVFEPIENLHFVRTGGEVGKPFKVEFGVEQGTGVVYTLDPDIPPFKAADGSLLGQSVSRNYKTWRRRSVTSQEFPAQEPLHFSWTLSAKNQLNKNSPATITVDFTIDRPIANATIEYEAQDPITDPENSEGISIGGGKWIKWTIKMAEGSSVVCSYDVKDGTAITTQPDTPLAEWNHPNGRTHTHTFNVAGTYDVIVEAKNGVNNFAKNYKVIVYEDPSSVAAQLNHPTANPTAAGLVNMTVSRTDGGGSLGDAKAEFTWGDGQVETVVGFQFGKIYSHVYKSGQFKAAVRIYNILGSTSSIEGTTMNLVQGLEDVWIKILPEHAAVNTEVKIDIDVAAGSDVTVAYDWETSDGQQSYPFGTPLTNTYTSVRNYTITVTVSNPVSSHPALTHNINVQYPAEATDFALTTTTPGVDMPSGTSSFSLAFTGANLPTAAAYTVDYGDGTQDDIAFTGGTKTFSHTYVKAGCWKAVVTVENKCSNTTKETLVKVGTPLSALTATPMYTPRIPLGADDKPGLGADSNEFTTAQTLRLHPNPTGTVLEYTVEVDGETVSSACVPGSTPEFSSTAPIEIPTKTGDFTIVLRGKDHKGTEVQTSIPVKIMEGVRKFDINVDQTPGNTKTLSFDGMTFNDATCLHVDFGDGKKVIYGGARCQVPPYTTKYPGATFMGPLTDPDPFTVSHTYDVASVYQMTTTLEDRYDRIEVKQEITAAMVECKTPSVLIKDSNPDFALPRECQRGFKCIVQGMLEELNCRSTLSNTRTWAIEEVFEATGKLRKTIPTETLPTYKQSTLIIPERFLKYGTYKLTFDVWMDIPGFPGGFKNTSSTFIRIIKSKLVAALVSGAPSVVVRGVRKHFLLRPGKHSYDPDVEPGANQNFTKFDWYCHESGGDSPETLDVNKVVGIDPPLDQPTIRANGGCFGTGPGRLDHSGPMVAVNPGLLKVDTVYNFTVRVHKDERSSTNTLLVRTINGDPPEVVITFVQEKLGTSMQTGKVVSPTYNLLLDARCTDSTCPEVATNRWTIFYNKTHFGWKEIPSVVSYLRGFDSEKIELNLPNIVKDFPTNHIKVQFKTTAPSRPSGYSELYLKLNFPPYGGTCDIQPRSGIAGNTTFTISCTDWKDREGPIQGYQVVASRVGQPPTTVASMTDKTATTELIAGSDMDEYRMGLVVLINDLEGSTARFEMGNITVEPQDPTVFAKEFEEMLLNPDSNKLALLAALEDPYETPKRMAAFGSSLNKFTELELKDTQAEEFTSTGYERKATGGKPVKKRSTAEKKAERAKRTKRARVRKQCVEAIGRLIPADMDQTNTILTSVAELTKQTADTSRGAQNQIVGIAKRICSSVKDMGQDLPEGKIVMAQEKLVEILGYYQESQSLSSDSPEDDDLLESQNSMEYDIDLTTKKDWLPVDVSEATEILSNDHNCDLQVESVSENQANVDDITDCLTRISRDHSVPGGDVRAMNTPKLQFANTEDKAKIVLGKTLILGRSTFQTPAACDVITCDEENPDPIIGVRTMAQPNTPWKPRVVRDQSTVPPKSDVLTMDIFDDKGEEINIRGLNKEFEIWINREASLVEQGKKSINHRNLTQKVHLEHFNLKIEPTNKDNHYFIKFSNYTSQLQVFFRYCYQFPNITTGDYNFTRRVPEYYPASARPLGYVVPVDPDSIIFEPELVNLIIEQCGGNLTMGIRFLNASLNEYNLYNDTNRPPTDITEKQWNYEILYPIDETPPHAFDVVMAATTCSYYDKVTSQWRHDGMRVGPKTTVYKTQCFTNHLTSIGSNWVVTPNKLDFAYILANLSPFKNPTLYVTIAVVIALYIIFAILARRLDNKDLEKCGLIPIFDNDPKDLYLYEMTVATGLRGNSGTRSKVHFILSGEFDETEVRVLNEQPDSQKYLKRGSIDNFLLALPRPLGPLNYMRVWHDNSGDGKNASWYLKYITLQDVQTKERFSFIAGRWFAVEEEDGQIDRLLPVAGREQVEEFGHLFSTESRKNMGDGHLWYSVIGRPPRSRFTRLQRVSCCLQILMLSMGASTLFYGKDQASGGGWSLGPFTLTPRQITIAVFTNLIIFPPTFLTVWLFRKTKPRRKRPNRILEALEKNQKMRTASVSDVRAEIHSDMSPLNDNEMVNDDTTPPRTAETTPRPLIVEGQEAIDLDGIRDGEKKKKKKKKKLNLPWWMLIVAWVVLWLTMLAGTTLLFLYGVMFGDELLRKWLTSFVISVIMSAFITQPIKVFLLALFVSLILKKTSDEDEEEGEEDEEPYLQNNEEWMYNQTDMDSLAAARPRSIAYKPPDPKQLEALRQSRVKEVKMYSILREFFSFTVFITVLLLISYGFRDPAAYQLQVHMQRMMVSEAGTDLDFSTISNFEQFWAWLERVYIPSLRADLWYTNDFNSTMSVNAPVRQPYGQRGFQDDRTSRMMGWAIMRQLRIPGNTCRGRVDPKMRDMTHECNDVYDIATEETGCFAPGWSRYTTCPSNVTSGIGYSWRYHTSTELQGFVWMGQLTMYSGGGYPFLFKGTEDNMQADLRHLKENLWLDKLSRGVFLEWALFNPNSGLFSVNTMLVEFPMTTGAVPTFRFEPVDLLGSFEPGAVLIQYAAQIGFVIFLLYYLIHEIREMVKRKSEYFTELWSWNELSIVFLSFIGIGIYFYRMYLVKDLVSRFMASRGLVYIKFQIVAQWHEILMYLVGLVVFFSNLKFIKLLRFNRRMSLLGSTLRRSYKDLINFGMMFSVIFFSYVQLFYLLFMRYLIGYKTVVASAETNMNIMLGKFNFQDMMNASPMLAPLFFFLYVLTMVMIVMNMFISILCETFSQVRGDLMKQGNDYEMVDFMMGRFKNWTGINKKTGEENLNNAKPVDGVSAPFEVQIDNFPHKVDKLLNSISKVYFDNDNLDSLLDPSTFGSNKELYKNLLKNNQVNKKNILPDIDENDDATSLKKNV